VGIAFLFTENCLRCDLSYTETWKLFAKDYGVKDLE